MKSVATASPETRTPAAGLIVRAWRPLERASLLGFVTIEVPTWHLCIFDIAIHQADNGERWAALPAKVQVDKSRNLVVRDGKVQYTPVLRFTDSETRRRFSDAVVAAVDVHLKRPPPPASPRAFLGGKT